MDRRKFTPAQRAKQRHRHCRKKCALELQACPSAMCKVAKDGVRGWMNREALWGMLATEVLD